MVIAGPDYEFLWGNGGCNGRNIDGGVWNMSGLHQGIKNGTVKLPEDETRIKKLSQFTLCFFPW